MNENQQNYQRDVLELLTVAVQYCALVEQAGSKSATDFIDTMLKLLPLLYLKGSLLPPFDMNDEVELSDDVAEADYDAVRSQVAAVMGGHDDFLDVFVEDMKYSDTPILCTVSEALADIYQDLRNFAAAYRDGTEEARIEAVAQCRANFEHYWGQRLLNAMRALHDLRYSDAWTDEADED